VTGADREHLRADDVGHLLHPIGVPGGGQTQSLRKRGRAAMQEAAHSLFMNHARDPEPGALHQHLLDPIGELRRLIGEETGAGTDPRHLTDSVGELAGDPLGIERLVLDENRHPHRPELRDLLLQRHPPEQVGDPRVDRGGRIPIDLSHLLPPPAVCSMAAYRVRWG
jgi:hypothetical protein